MPSSKQISPNREYDSNSGSRYKQNDKELNLNDLWPGTNFHSNLFISALPRPPTNLRVSDVSPTSVKLTWNYPRGRDGVPRDVQFFVIQYKPKLASWDYKEISGAITTFYDIRGLTPYTEYEFVVLAKNNVGRGPKSDPVVVTTGETGIVIIHYN